MKTSNEFALLLTWFVIVLLTVSPVLIPYDGKPTIADNGEAYIGGNKFRLPTGEIVQDGLGALLEIRSEDKVEKRIHISYGDTPEDAIKITTLNITTRGNALGAVQEKILRAVGVSDQQIQDLKKLKLKISPEWQKKLDNMPKETGPDTLRKVK